MRVLISKEKSLFFFQMTKLLKREGTIKTLNWPVFSGFHTPNLLPSLSLQPILTFNQLVSLEVMVTPFPPVPFARESALKYSQNVWNLLNFNVLRL